MPRSNRFTFPKSERLKRKKIIAALFQDGFRLRQNNFSLICYEHQFSEVPALQVLFALHHKHFRMATTRNKIKRRMREAWRLNKHVLNEKIAGSSSKWAVGFIYHGKQVPTFLAVQTALKDLLNQFQKMLTEKSA
ncbi:MAG: ribonuclease P protein component [Chitinophagales bacterium]|nr:ribonuclease P protein component [Chitinophagales bacterium]MDW8273844.1 ribonuclease P protein component [Chitinophagales bacterium]